MSDGVNALSVRRAFGWGMVIVGDSEAQDIPSPEHGAVVRSDTAVVVVVRHAQDVDDIENGEFQVALECIAGPTDGIGLAFDGDILVSSGRISIGDADHEDMLDVAPGRWRLQIATEPAEYPQHVTVWISPGASG